MPAGAGKIQIPRWIQLVGLPMLLLFVWALATAVGHVLFLFLTAAMIALLLDPLVRGIGRARLPRGFAVAIVYIAFAAAIIGAIAGIATVVVDQTRSASGRIQTYFTDQTGQPPRTAADRDIDRLQVWLNTHHLKRIKIRKQGHDLVKNIKGKDVEHYTTKVIDFVRGAAIGTAKLLFSLVLIFVVSVYMLLDMGRFARAVDRRFPPPPGSHPLVLRIEHALVGYVKGQALLSLIIGTSAGLGLWVLGTLGAAPGADRYALLFGTWVGVTELVPYLGPWLGAIPPFVYELVVHPISALWVGILFVVIHQVEGHIVVPNVMGQALRLHPLLVIFGLLAGGEIYGFPGIFVALPLLAALRAIWEFFGQRIELEPWREGEPVPVPVPVAVEPEPAAAATVVPLAPEEPPAAAPQPR